MKKITIELTEKQAICVWAALENYELERGEISQKAEARRARDVARKIEKAYIFAKRNC